MSVDATAVGDAGVSTDVSSGVASPADTSATDSSGTASAAVPDSSSAVTTTSSDATSSGGTSPDTTSPDTMSSSNTSSPATSSIDGDNAATSSPLAALGGWSDAVSGGWNSGERSVGNVRRIPIGGLQTVNADSAPHPVTTESAAGRAIIIVPAQLDVSQPIDVLLHLHGHNIGYRQRIASSLPDAGSVRDVLVDQIEDQLSSSGRAMIAVLPQGTLVSKFSPGSAAFDCDAFLTEVLNAAMSAGIWSTTPNIARVVLSGHSGGGNTIGPLSGQSGQPHLPSKIAALFLFEAINGSYELTGITSYITQKLNADLAALGSASDQLAYLKTSFRFRGIYNTQDDFYATNYATLAQTTGAWFARNAAALGGQGSDVYAAFVANYVVVNPSPFVVHDGLLGSGNLLSALAMLM